MEMNYLLDGDVNFKYVIDSCAIISGIKAIYTPAVFPTVWDEIKDLVEQGTILLIPEVVKEIEVKEGDVAAAWVDSAKGLVHPIPQKGQEVEAVLADFRQKHTPQPQRGRRKPRKHTDLRVIAWAKALKIAVVTEEKERQGGGGHKIPSICKEEGVKCIRLGEMMRQENLQFS